MSIATDGYGALTLCEQQVCNFVVQGLTHKQIASKFGLSTRTVEQYVKRVLVKTGCCNRVVLTRELVNVAWLPT